VDVYDLIGGRAAWTVLGLPTEGQVGDRRRVSQYVLPAPSVGIDATIADATRLGAGEHPIAVTSASGVLLGALQATSLGLPERTPVERVMISAPGTVRPDLRVDEVLEQLRKEGLGHVYVTTASGVLIGLVVRGEVHV
jgi:CBS domain-containing protein